MSLESLNLNTSPEKQKTPEQLALEHINLESKKAEEELKREKRWGKLVEFVGEIGITSAAIGIGISIFEATSGTLSPELRNFLNDPSLSSLISSKEAFMFFSMLLTGTISEIGLKKNSERIQKAVEVAQQKKNHIISQYLNVGIGIKP